MKKPSVKKIWVNNTNTDSKTKNSIAFKYFYLYSKWTVFLWCRKSKNQFSTWQLLFVKRDNLNCFDKIYSTTYCINKLVLTFGFKSNSPVFLIKYFFIWKYSQTSPISVKFKISQYNQFTVTHHSLNISLL